MVIGDFPAKGQYFLNLAGGKCSKGFSFFYGNGFFIYSTKSIYNCYEYSIFDENWLKLWIYYKICDIVKYRYIHDIRALLVIIYFI